LANQIGPGAAVLPVGGSGAAGVPRVAGTPHARQRDAAVAPNSVPRPGRVTAAAVATGASHLGPAREPHRRPWVVLLSSSPVTVPPLPVGASSASGRPNHPKPARPGVPSTSEAGSAGGRPNPLDSRWLPSSRAAGASPAGVGRADRLRGRCLGRLEEGDPGERLAVRRCRPQGLGAA